MSPIRLLATDLDGTLLRSDNTVSAFTRAALDRAAAAGFPVVMVTGRPIRWLPEVADITGMRGVAVAANGALLYDLDAERIVEVHPLQPAQLAELTGLLREAFPKVQFAVEYGVDFAYETQYRHDWVIEPTADNRGRHTPKVIIGELADIVSRPAVKLLARNRVEPADSFLADATNLLGDLASVTRSGTATLVEIAAPGITKATGLAAVVGHHGVDRLDVAAVGDMPNDVPMLEWAGHSFAVANAHPDAIAAAGQVIESNDEDAVAHLVERIRAAAGRPGAGSRGDRRRRGRR